MSLWCAERSAIILQINKILLCLDVRYDYIVNDDIHFMEVQFKKYGK